MNMLLNSTPKGQKANSFHCEKQMQWVFWAPKGQKANSPGQRPGYKDVIKFALKGQKPYLTFSCFCPYRA